MSEKIKTKKEELEKISFWLIVISALLIINGIILGSFFKYLVALSIFGEFLFFTGVFIFIISQAFTK